MNIDEKELLARDKVYSQLYREWMKCADEVKKLVRENHWLKNCYRDIRDAIENKQYKCARNIIKELLRGIDEGVCGGGAEQP